MELIRLPVRDVVRPLFENATLRANTQRLLANKSEFLKVDVGNGVTLDGYMLKSANFDLSRKYPVLVNVYGEPAAQSVLDRWSGAAEYSIARSPRMATLSLASIIAARRRPKARVEKNVYGSVGPLATAEQTAAIQELCRQRSYLDSDRIAVWGWSGGGTDTLTGRMPLMKALEPQFTSTLCWRVTSKIIFL